MAAYMNIARASIGAALLALAVTARIGAAEPESTSDELQRVRARLLAEMRALARQTQVSFQQGERQPQLVEAPVFRYDDKPRKFADATLWVWTEGGRPAAFEKVEAMAESPPRWGYCFTSVSERLLTVRWGDGRTYHSTEPGVDFRPLPAAPAATVRNSDRRLQARKLVSDFSARILTDDRTNASEEMRLLPTPIYEYVHPETKSFLGAVFAIATSGTNPDALILLEPREENGKSAWHFAVARMTAGGVNLKYKDETIWQAAFCEPVPTALTTWTFFNTLRTESPDASEKSGRKKRPEF